METEGNPGNTASRAELKARARRLAGFSGTASAGQMRGLIGG